jgi:hypothetical protein
MNLSLQLLSTVAVLKADLCTWFELDGLYQHIDRCSTKIANILHSGPYARLCVQCLVVVLLESVWLEQLICS